jgi:hypothetical protein
MKNLDPKSEKNIPGSKILVKIKLIVTKKSDKDPDPHWFCSRQPNSDLDLHLYKKLNPDPMWIHNTKRNTNRKIRITILINLPYAVALSGSYLDKKQNILVDSANTVPELFIPNPPTTNTC